jgi:hypothetical protein
MFMRMSTLDLSADWAHICHFFPSNLDELAKETGAVVRWRHIKSGEELQRLNLAYVVDDLSLRSTAGWSTGAAMATITDTSVLHRLRQSAPFLEAVLAHLLGHRIHGEAAAGPAVRLNDATVISIPGSRGTDWRIHAVYDPAATRLVRVQVTDCTGGERLDRDTYVPGEVVIADRGLAHARGIHAVADAHAYTLLRMHWQNLRLVTATGALLIAAEVLRRADHGETGTLAYVPLEGHDPVLVRLLVRPLPADRAAEARRRLRRNATKKGRTPSAFALELAGYCCLLTTLPEAVASDDVVWELYRIRWQIELFFKRCKNLLHLDALRADDPQLVRAYCTTKLIEVVLIELLTSEGRFFSPWGVPRTRRAARLAVA